MAANSKLHQAKSAKKDEFYTQLTDIEKELKYYKDKFKNKVVFCNCDDPVESNFFEFFVKKFKKLELKRLITTHYQAESPSYKLEVYLDAGGRLRQKKTSLIGNGDFRSDECVELLKESDIVVTNPPFSLFREYVSLLMEYKKKFIIIGNQNAVTYKEIFSFIKDNKIWYGPSVSGGERLFRVPSDYLTTSKNITIDEKGEKFIGVGIRWFTNLDHKARHEDLILYKRYKKSDYPKYDNYDAINVDKTKEIPMDYDGAMGVPITFLDKYNPDQFEIVGQMVTTKVTEVNHGYPYINGKKKYARIIIKRKV